MALKVNIETIHRLPAAQKGAIVAVLLLLIVGGFVYYVYRPMSTRLHALEVALTDLRKEMSVNRAKAARLAELKELNVFLQRRLAELQVQLPPEPEIPLLLRKVSDLGQATGLTITVWKPEPKRQSPTGLYVELPVSVAAAAGYHALGNFFDRISRLPRIVNIVGLKMGEAKTEEKRFSIKIDFTVIAFAATPAAATAKGP